MLSVLDMPLPIFDGMVNKLRSDLRLKSRSFIKQELENRLLQSWFLGHPITCFNGKGHIVWVRAISKNELIKNFLHFLPSRYTQFIKTMWEGSDILQACFRDNTFSDAALFSNFQKVVSGPSLSVVEGIWKDNIRLHNLIRTLDFYNSKNLLRNILNSYSRGDFAKQYLEWLDNKALICIVLAELRDQNPEVRVSEYKRGKINLLLNFVQRHTYTFHTYASEESASLKRTAPEPEHQSKRQKTAMTVTIDLAKTIHLIEPMPPLSQHSELVSELYSASPSNNRADEWLGFSPNNRESFQQVAEISPAIPSVKADKSKAQPSFFDESFGFFCLNKDEVEFFAKILEPANDDDSEDDFKKLF